MANPSNFWFLLWKFEKFLNGKSSCRTPLSNSDTFPFFSFFLQCTVLDSIVLRMHLDQQNTFFYTTKLLACQKNVLPCLLRLSFIPGLSNIPEHSLQKYARKDTFSFFDRFSPLHCVLQQENGCLLMVPSSANKRRKDFVLRLLSSPLKKMPRCCMHSERRQQLTQLRLVLFSRNLIWKHGVN